MIPAFLTISYQPLAFFVPNLLLAATSPGGAPQQSPIPTILMFTFMGLIMYFMLLRPQQKRQKDHQKLISQMKTGDIVVTSGGIHGTITNVKETTILLKVADNVKIEFNRSAIVGIVKSTESAPAASETP